MGVQTGHNVGVAFALTIAAGCATILGGLVVFHRKMVHLANPQSLAVALSVSAGVMLFISLVEIFNESIELFTQGLAKPGLSDKTLHGHAWLCTTACAIAGIVLIYVVDVIVGFISPDHHATELGNLNIVHTSKDSSTSSDNKKKEGTVADGGKEQVLDNVHAVDIKLEIDDHSRENLQRMGLLSALAVGIHNVPEGVATYVGSMHNSSVGFSLAIGIGLHNIPEGIAVAASIYFATGSRWRGVLWCTVSALAEPVGGIIAWLAVGDGMDPVSEGVLFGLVCGIMVCISLKELVPTAFKFAQGRTNLVTFGMLFGMLIMVSSLILFAYAGV